MNSPPEHQTTPSPLAARVRFGGGYLEFDDPVGWLQADELGSVVTALESLEYAVAAGHYAVGFVSFEAAPAFDPAFPELVRPEGLPLLGFAVFRQATFVKDGMTAEAQQLELSVVAGEGAHDDAGGQGPERYRDALAKIHRAIGEGDVYQVNYTFPFWVDTPNTDHRHELSSGLFDALCAAQGGGYGALLKAGPLEVLSASPELFFELNQGRIRVKPMKGTAPRGRFVEEDEAIARALQTSAKDRAENLMIVDMMRNDLGRIARVGSVEVPALFDVERLPTLHQMTSTVTAETDVSLTEVFGALFPCASITGAPKGAALRKIDDLEAGPRGIYTGAVGMVLPTHPQQLGNNETHRTADSGPYARFNVAIRTAWRTEDHSPFHYGVGSGVVWDSDAVAEHAECRSKALALTAPEPAFSLLETMLVRRSSEARRGPSRIWLLQEHLARLQASADYFSVSLDQSQLFAALEAAMLKTTERARLRLLVDKAGACSTEVQLEPISLCRPSRPLRVALAADPIDSANPFLFHKTTHRTVYDESLQRARERYPDIDDVLLWNERGELTETTIANIAVAPDTTGHPWLTPARESGLLAGTLRQRLLDRGWLEETTLHVEDLKASQQLVLLNSVRGTLRTSIVR